MKKILVVLVLLATAAIWLEAAAPETYSVTLNLQSSVDQLDMGRGQKNDDTCTGLGLAVGCTQSAACVAKGISSGCTAAEASAAGCRIYANTLSGREAFVGLELVKAKLADFVAEQRRRDAKAAATACAGFNQTQKNAVCTAYGLPAGCLICD
jgi:hypothetical protein